VRYTTTPAAFPDELETDAGFIYGIRYLGLAKRHATIVTTNVGGNISAQCRLTTVVAPAIPGARLRCIMDIPGHFSGTVESILGATMQMEVPF
jgi:hypothetical protein